MVVLSSFGMKYSGMLKEVLALLYSEQFGRTITMTSFRCEDVILDNMEVPKNIAKNEALRENVFMMTMCIENRIPLFIVGKPGSSKSLAKTIVSSSMNGKTSSKELMKEFKEV